jgi:hypothetical protein
MKAAIEGYIKTCEALIAQHMLIEDADERVRAVTAQTKMKEDFEALLETL